MLSIASPFSSFFSISTISLTPSTTSWTCCTSEEPRRSALEMSKTPPTEAVSTPPERCPQESVRSTSTLPLLWEGNLWRTCAALLQTQPGEDLLKLGMRAQLGQLDVHAAAQACSEVGRARQDVSQMLVPHEAMVVLLKDRLNLMERQVQITLLKNYRSGDSNSKYYYRNIQLIFNQRSSILHTRVCVPPSAGQRRSA